MQKCLIWWLAILGALYLFLSRDHVPCSVGTWRAWCTACFSVRRQVANVEVRFNSYTAGAMIYNSYYSSARVAQPKKETSEEKQCHWRINSNVKYDFYLCFSEKRPAVVQINDCLLSVLQVEECYQCLAHVQLIFIAKQNWLYWISVTDTTDPSMS